MVLERSYLVLSPHANAMVISNDTPDPTGEYSQEVMEAKNMAAFAMVLDRYRPITEDVLLLALGLTDEELARMQDLALRMKSQITNQPDEEEFNSKYSYIIYPFKAVLAAMMSHQFGSPWGTAWLLMEKEGWSIIKDGKIDPKMV